MGHPQATAVLEIGVDFYSLAGVTESHLTRVVNETRGPWHHFTISSWEKRGGKQMKGLGTLHAYVVFSICPLSKFHKVGWTEVESRVNMAKLLENHLHDFEHLFYVFRLVLPSLFFLHISMLYKVKLNN